MTEIPRDDSQQKESRLTPQDYWDSSELAFKVASGRATPAERDKHDQLIRRILLEPGPSAVFMSTSENDLIVDIVDDPRGKPGTDRKVLKEFFPPTPQPPKDSIKTRVWRWMQTHL